MIIICADCKKVIGCGITESGDIKKLCCNCYNTACEATPIKEPVKKGTHLIVRFENACSDHGRIIVGFKIEHSP